MRPKVLKALRELSKAIISGEMGKHDGLARDMRDTFLKSPEVAQLKRDAKRDRLWIQAQRLMDESDLSNISVTLKNYGRPKGVSTTLHEFLTEDENDKNDDKLVDEV